MSDVETDQTRRVQFGATIRRLRKEAGLSQERLARKANVSGSYISILETAARDNDYDKMRMSPNIVIRLAQALGTPVNDLLDAAGIRRPTGRMDFATFVNSEPTLTRQQRAAIITLYKGLVGES